MTAGGGSRFGVTRRGTILRYNNDGTVRIGLDEGTLVGAPNEFNSPIPSAWSGPEGEFMGGFPSKGSSVTVNQGQGGEWFVNSYIKSNDIFDGKFISIGSTKMDVLKPGRAVIQTKNDNYLFIDPNIGTQIGNSKNYIHINPNKDIISHNYSSEMSFTSSGRNLSQKIKRDVFDNKNRDVLGSVLDSQAYDDSLFTIGMDPTSAISSKTIGTLVRNPALAETRELVYEFSSEFDILNDQDESSKYTDPNFKPTRPKVSRRNMRADTLSLSLEYPNHLIEITKGTVVDSFGNILDINRNIIPIGKTDNISLRKNSDKSDAYNRIRALSRKSIAYHFELNARKGGIEPIAESSPNVSSIKDYARDRSRFFVDIDKEGQFKINVPASSETGNLSLLTRYENYSTLLSKKDNSVNSNEFLRNAEKRDIFLENFAGKPGINLVGDNVPIDRNTDQPIKYGTAFHDITKTCESFTVNSPFLADDRKYISYYKEHHLNTSFVPYTKIVSDSINISGNEANAGNRSGVINCDGMISLNIGANTIDRQSLWLDLAGGIVSNVGRDLNGISYAGTMNGDFLLELNGVGVGSNFDSRFENENDALKFPKLIIHVITSNGPAVISIGTMENGSAGIDLSSPGSITLSAQQDIILKAKGAVKIDSEVLMLHAESSKRVVNKYPANSI